eukprot:4000925-Karenia_brevis.AAC.1
MSMPLLSLTRSAESTTCWLRTCKRMQASNSMWARPGHGINLESARQTSLAWARTSGARRGS